MQGAEDPGPRDASVLKVVGRGFSWITGFQLATSGCNLVLTPFVIHGLGLQRYGLFVFSYTITAFLGSLNGGLMGASSRYMPVYAGADDRTATTRLLVSFCSMVVMIGAVLSLIDWFATPFIVRALSMSPSLRPESLFLFRTLGGIFTLGMLHQLVQSVSIARQRFDRVIQAGIACYLLWVAGLVIVVHYHYGLRGIAVVVLLQQVATIVVIWPTSVQYLTRSGLRLLSIAEFREVFSFSAKVQVTGLASLINQQIDTLLVGSVLSVRTVGIYNSGNSFSSQLSSVATNAVAPTYVHLGNTYGKEGGEATFRALGRLQKVWARGILGWTAVGAAAAYFAITAWLGPQFRLGGWVAVACIAGAMAALIVSLISTYVTVMREAGIEMRYGLVQVAVNLCLTVPMVALGAIEVALAAATSQVVGAIYLIRTARKRLRPDIPNPLEDLPLFRGALAAGVTVALELVVRPYVTRGALGLLECVPPAAIGLAVFAVSVVGPRRCGALLRAAIRQRGVPRNV